MERTVTAVLFDPWLRNYDRASAPVSRAVERFRRAIHSKANPRDELYMLALLDERWPQAMKVRVNGDDDWQLPIETADVVVLLYPDPIGLGFADLENEIYRIKKPWAEVRVLNGRRREFVLAPAVRRQLRRRRFLERWMVLEFAFIPFFLVVTPFMLLVDLMRGRR